jgi:hypothetical protein
MPVFGQIVIAGVLPGYESDLFGSGPAFELLLSCYGLGDGFEGFGVEEAGATVLVGEAGEGAGSMLGYAEIELAGDADVESAGSAS